MAPGASTLAVGVAVGAAAAACASQAFVPAAGSGAQRPQFLSPTGSAQVDGATDSSSGSQLAGGAAAVAALGVAALISGKRGADAARGRRAVVASVVARRAEGEAEEEAETESEEEAEEEEAFEEVPLKPFAGGLIGGESAFTTSETWKYYNFDPWDCSVKAEQYLPWFREAELKHGRVAMLAFVGMVVPDFVRLPGPAWCFQASNVDAGMSCWGTDIFFPFIATATEFGPNILIWIFATIIEMTTTFPKCVQGLTLENAGDYELGKNFLPKDEAKANDMRLKELKNGRLAMIAFGGAITQTVLSGNGFPWLFGERPHKAREGPGLASGPRPAAQRLCAPGGAGASASASSRSGGGAVGRAAAESGYKMSQAVPFLPMSPALEGYPGEEDGFDPMGVSLAIDARWLREAELKHGRVAMLATVGWIATDLGMRMPGEPFQVSTIEAHGAMVKFGAMPQMLCWIGYAELFGFLAINNMMEGQTDRKPGDFGIRLLYPKDEQGQYDMQMKELRNGRLAMLAFSGMATAAVLTGKTWPFFATGEPRRRSVALPPGSALCGSTTHGQACAGAVAVRASSSSSLPFLPRPDNLAGWVGQEQEFDPLGFSDTFDMKWLREAELKHGRVCMMAVVGFAAQEYITFPGMTPTPDALQAVYAAPVPAMATLLFLAGYIESASYGGKITMLDMFEPDRVPGDFNFGAGFLKGKSEKEVYDMKLKELQNGRLAMLAFGGMVHHNIIVKGPLFPLFPDGWELSQNVWNAESVMGRL